jgi:23S rRNA (adenine2503-C2)-methyltransferase
MDARQACTNADPEPTTTASDPVRVDLKGLLPEELAELVGQLGQPPFRVSQLLSWVHGRGVADLDRMTDLSKSFRTALRERAWISQLAEVARQESAGGEAIKFLFGLPEGERVESVLIVDRRRRTACLSSQVGCGLGCRFCATGRMGFVRDLRAAQIVDQVLHLDRYLRERGERVSNVVLMGMGEPLLNYEEVLRATRLMRLEHGPAIGGRKITVSTAGYVPGIDRLSREDLNLGLAVSLNATTDELRSRLMPINRRYRIAELLAAARQFFERRGRRVTFEYVLLSGVNDADEDAHRLAELTRDVPCKLNLIPYNEPRSDPPFRRPPAERIARFRQLLESLSPRAVTLRESRGQDIDAACGQLYQAQAGSRREAPRTP